MITAAWILFFIGGVLWIANKFSGLNWNIEKPIALFWFVAAVLVAGNYYLKTHRPQPQPETPTEVVAAEE